jgi:YHS domain-containing protein
MRTKILSCLTFVTALSCYAAGLAADAPQLMCPVSGHPASTKYVAEHHGGKVYFCCDQCAKTFAANEKKFTAKANVQMILSGQFKQVDCPLEGYSLNPVTAMEVAGVKVLFCCKGCRNVVVLARKEDRINLVFNDKSFKKGFAKVAANEKK